MSDTQLALVTRKPDVTEAEFRHMIGVAKVLAESGFFKDAYDGPKALAKMMLGREYGLGFMDSLLGIHVIEGQLSLSSGVIAAAIKSSQKYDYDVIESSDERCEVAFYNKVENREIGRLSLTIQEADKSGLSLTREGRRKQMWQKNPSDLLFARVVTRGCRRYMPDVFSTSIYVPEELDAEREDAPKSVANGFTPRTEVSIPAPAKFDDAPVEEIIPEGELETQDALDHVVEDDLSPLIEDYEALRAECNEKNIKSPKGPEWPALASGANEGAIRKAIGMARVSLEEFEQASQAFEQAGDAFDDDEESVEYAKDHTEPVAESPFTKDEPNSKDSKRHAMELKFYEACEEMNLSPTSPAMMPAINAMLKKQGAAEIESLRDAPVGVIFVLANHIKNGELIWSKA